MDRPLDNESEDLARKLPGAPLMLKAMAGQAPEGLLAPLQMFHNVSWRGLNSFAHAGVHPLRRQSDGFPTKLACQLLRNGNGILHMAYRMLAMLTGSQVFMTAVTDLWKTHRNCLPIDPNA